MDGTTLDRIQRAIDLAVRSAGPAMRAHFVHDAWIMNAAEFLAFWETPRVAGFCTVSPSARPHVVPVEPSFVDGVFHMRTVANAVRLKDIASNAQAAIIAWEDALRAMTIYGSARALPESGGMVTVELLPERIYAIRPPVGHHARNR